LELWSVSFGLRARMLVCRHVWDVTVKVALAVNFIKFLQARVLDSWVIRYVNIV